MHQMIHVVMQNDAPVEAFESYAEALKARRKIHNPNEGVYSFVRTIPFVRSKEAV